MGIHNLSAALEKLQDEFPRLNFTYHDFQVGSQNEKMYRWPGPPEEDILVCVHKSNGIQELFHRHDFFYFNYTYKGQYESLSYRYDHKITIREDELYAGQPFAGHALCVHDNQEAIILGVLIKRDTFFRSFLPMLSAGSKLFRFFLDPATKHYSEEFIHFKVENRCTARMLLEMMAVEYAFKRPDTQQILKPLTLAFLMEILRKYNAAYTSAASETLSGQIVQYMSEHIGTVTLREIADRFSYHPNYISTVMRREQGKTFSQILLEQRMDRAAVLLKGTALSVEEISLMLGYSNSSNFHKAFREFYHCSPREFGNVQPCSP